jgi:hypothetical protein
MNASDGNLQLSQGYEVLPPKSGKAYPVLCDEWCFLKAKLNNAKWQPWILQSTSFLFFGVSLTSLVSILFGSVSPGHPGNGITLAWAVFASSGAIGLACICLAFKQRKIQRSQVSEVVKQMELIEKRYEQSKV